MSIKEIAQKVVELNKVHNYQEIYNTLYSPDVVSVEFMDGPMKEVVGMDKIMEKMKWWTENNEVHSIEVSEPLVADTHFAITFTMDVTDKNSGNRNTSTELAVYQVSNGKITREEFFYSVD